MEHTITLPTPPGSLEYSWRPATQQDAQAMHDLLVATEAVDQRGWADTLEEREKDLNDPDINLETDTLLAFTADGKLAGFAWALVLPPGELEHIVFIWGEVHPDQRGRGLGSFLLEWMEARGRQALASRPQDVPHNLRANFNDHLTDHIALYEQHGFQPVRTYYRMKRDLSLPIPGAPIPSGIRLQKYTPDLDDAVRQTINEAFIDHWGNIPMNEEIWSLYFISTSDFRPDLSFMALAEDGQVAGVCFNEIRQEENIAFDIRQGWIRSLAVRRPWRQQGLATALMCASMQAFKEAGMDWVGLGVDAENLTGALRIYEKMDFTVYRRFFAYGKTV